jgi:hypothetical protein
LRKSEKQGRDAVLNFSEHKRKRVDELEADLDALFTQPLTEFTSERNALAARLKKSGRGEEAALVKALAKPPISAWAVNQLYWNHRETFDELLASSERVHKTQASGKVAAMREALNARREALTELSDLATSLLREGGHNPSLDIIRRITSTLEAMSAMSDGASRSDAPRPGRLTHDVDPPGFESLASWMPAGMMQRAEEGKETGGRRQTAVAASAETPKPGRFNQKSSSGPSSDVKRRKASAEDGIRHDEEKRKAQIAEAKASLQEAQRSLAQARARAQRLEAAQKKADAEAKKAEKHRRDVERTLEKAKAVWEDLSGRARSVADDLVEAASVVDDAERTVEKASRELELLSRESR